jgi:short-subunit dehydrogenase
MTSGKSAATRPRALVTGASAGIGRELAREFATRGYDLVVVARRRSRLASLKRELESAHGVRVRVVEADLYAAGAVGRLARSLARTPVDVLVNNAGTMEGGGFARSDPERIGQMLQLNVVVLVELTHALLPGMLRRRQGRVMNLASIAAFAPLPNLAVYAATKAFVLSFSEALLEELRGTGITVTAVCPGLTRSEMTDAALERARELAPYRQLLFAEAADVARVACAGCLEGEAIVTPGAANQFYETLMKISPRAARRRLTAQFGRILR